MNLNICQLIQHFIIIPNHFHLFILNDFHSR
jgi:hypothetical protein